MFSFGKNKEATKVIDVVFMNKAAKWHACNLALKADAATVFIAWFEETQQQLQAFFKDQNQTSAEVILYRQASAHYTADKQIIFVEHYPLLEKEATLFVALNLKEVKIFSSLDEPLFQYYGGERIIEIIKNTGVNENEYLQHPMISRALKKAQEKLAEKILIEQSAQSQSEWFRRNLCE